jgi:Acetyltransferase (GNAT) domain
MVGAALGVDRHPARHRIRYRPVFDTEQPDQEVAGLLVEAAAREGMRSLSLHELPAHGGVQATVAALEAAGFAVHRRERQSECLAVVEGGWAEHRRRFASYDRSVRTKANRLKALWNVTLEEYGPSAGAPVADGFPIYLELYHRSWRQPLSEAYQAYLLELLRGTEALGWPRLYVLLIAGVPAAVHLWSHLGPVATWHSTAYDQRLAATSAGSSIMWWAHERIFAGATPRLLDLMPGHNLLKDRLGPDRAPIVMLEASRRTLVSGSASRSPTPRAASAGASPTACAPAAGRRPPGRRPAGARPGPSRRSRPAPASRGPRWRRWSWTRACGASWPWPAATPARRRWPHAGPSGTPGGGWAMSRRRRCDWGRRTPAGGRCARSCCSRCGERPRPRSARRDGQRRRGAGGGRAAGRGGRRRRLRPAVPVGGALAGADGGPGQGRSRLDDRFRLGGHGFSGHRRPGSACARRPVAS